MKMFWFGLFLVLWVGTLQAKDFLVEAKGAYFYPTDGEFREIYGDGSGRYGVEMSGEIWRKWYGWVSADWFGKSGKSEGLHDDTQVMLVPIALGVKSILPVNDRFDLYVGVGGQATWIHTRDHSPFVFPSVNKWAWGGIAKAGILINAKWGLFFDIFADYSFMAKVSNETRDFDSGVVGGRKGDVSGVGGGIGIGYRFGCKDADSYCCDSPQHE